MEGGKESGGDMRTGMEGGMGTTGDMRTPAVLSRYKVSQRQGE
jgi:hypothetical protein